MFFDLLKRLLCNLSRPYFETLFIIIFNPKLVAQYLKLREENKGISLPLTPKEYLVSGIVHTVVILTLLAIVFKQKPINKLYSFIMGLYICSVINTYSIIISLFVDKRLNSRTLNYSILAYIVGTIFPISFICIVSLEYFRFIISVSYINLMTNLLLMITGLVGLYYMYFLFSKIYELSLSRLFIAIIFCVIINNFVILDIFMVIVSILKKFELL